MWGFDYTAGHTNKGAQCQKASMGSNKGAQCQKACQKEPNVRRARNVAMPWPPQVQYVQVQDQVLKR